MHACTDSATYILHECKIQKPPPGAAELTNINAELINWLEEEDAYDDDDEEEEEQEEEQEEQEQEEKRRIHTNDDDDRNMNISRHTRAILVLLELYIFFLF